MIVAARIRAAPIKVAPGKKAVPGEKAVIGKSAAWADPAARAGECLRFPRLAMARK
jgi:hypothetical protein